MRGLLRGEQVSYRGTTLQMLSAPRNVPMYVAAAGPKMLRMAARVADGIIIGSGILPEVIEDTLDTIRTSAAAPSARSSSAVSLSKPPTRWRG